MGMLFSKEANSVAGNHMVSKLVEIFNKVASSKDEAEIQQLLKDAQTICTIPDRVQVKELNRELSNDNKKWQKIEKDPTLPPPSSSKNESSPRKPKQ